MNLKGDFSAEIKFLDKSQKMFISHRVGNDFIECCVNVKPERWDAPNAEGISGDPNNKEIAFRSLYLDHPFESQQRVLFIFFS